MKKILVYGAIIVSVFGVVLAAIWYNNHQKPTVNIPPVSEQLLIQTPEPIGMCYQYSKEVSTDVVDRSWLKMSISGNQVTGEYRNLPAEKDSKVGTFTGTVDPMNPAISGRIADVWWDSMAEGMTVTEQLYIEFGEGSAVALFGEMTDRGDGTYVYKDTKKLTPGFQMSQIDCETLTEKNTVEKYIRENIKTIALEKPVLGGSWYVTLVQINPSMKTGTITYEDGHIQRKTEFNYTINNNEVAIVLRSPRSCYQYHQVATTKVPYAVDEYIDITINGTTVTGTKQGNQSGPDMTNGYTGTLNGTIDKDLITVIFSYTIEGSKNKEKELYKIVSTGLQKMRYPLIEQVGMLIPDSSKKFTLVPYITIPCSSI